MPLLERLRLALASAPVAEPCTAAAVGTLYTAAYAAARQVAPAERLLLPDEELEEACAQEQVPTACVPVLGWLAKGLSSGLPPAASKQAYNLACALLGVLFRQLPWRIQGQLYAGPNAGAPVKREADLLLRQLGPREALFTQLEQVLVALLRVTYPTSISPARGTGTSISANTSTSSSRPAVPLQEVAALALAWEQVCYLLTSFAVAAEPVSMVVAPLKFTGLLQVLLEGTLLLLATAPEVPPTEEQQQLQLWDAMKSACTAGSYMTMALGASVFNEWHAYHMRQQRAASTVVSQNWWDMPLISDMFEPWMPAMFRLKVLLLAKMHWDMRQCPELMNIFLEAAAEVPPPEALARAVRRMVSPCVAGDLLRQRAPGLLPHKRRCKRQVPTRNGRRREVVEETLATTLGSPVQLGDFLFSISSFLKACKHDGRVFDAIDAQDLALLLEATELYGLISPNDVDGGVNKSIWATFVQILACPHPVLASFAATCGEALIGVAEHLVEDVVLVSSGAAPAPTNTTGCSSSSSSTTKGGSSSSSGSSSRARPRAGRDNPVVTLVHRVGWAQDTVGCLGLLMSQQALKKPPREAAYWEADGYGAGVVHGLMTSSTAPRLLRVVEASYRVPHLMDPRLLDLLYVLPCALPGLYAAASSPKGSRALLSAVTTAAKRQQAANCVLEQLVKASGQLEEAAAGVQAWVPGPMGAKVAEQLQQEEEDSRIVVRQAADGGLTLVRLASMLFVRAAALVDPHLAPLAAYLAARKLPPGQNSKPWAVEAAVRRDLCGSSDGEEGGYSYSRLLARSPAQVAEINKGLALALAAQHAAAARQQAAKLSQAAGGATEEEQLCQQLQGLWLGRNQGVVAGLSLAECQALTLSQAQVTNSSTATATDGNSSSSSSSSSSGGRGPALTPDERHVIMRMLQQFGVPEQEVAAAGNPAEWATALGPISEEDRRVAATALLAACKAAGSVAQLPQLVRELQPVLEQQSWCRDMAKGQWGQRLLGSDTRATFLDVATWALLLAPVLGLLLPADKAAQLQDLVNGATDSRGRLQTGTGCFTGDKVMQLLRLLGQVVAPGAPGCSHPDCCNLEGRSEAELPVQLCTRCRGARYCCREHQVAHWKAGHKEVCRAAQAAVQEVQDSRRPAS